MLGRVLRGGSGETTGRPARDGDAGSLHVLEAILMSFVLLGTVGYVLSLDPAGSDAPAARRSDLRTVAEDALTILIGLPSCPELTGAVKQDCVDAYGDSAAGRHVVEAFHGATSRLERKVRSLLPDGAEFTFSLHNGVEAFPLFGPTDEPPGERVSASIPYTPEWSLTYLVPDLSCYDPNGLVNLTVLPVWRSAFLAKGPKERGLEFTNEFKPALQPAKLPWAFNGTYHKDLGGKNGFPLLADGLVEANVAQGAEALQGRARVDAAEGACATGRTTWESIRAGLNVTRVDVSGLDSSLTAWKARRNFTPGETLRATVDFSRFHDEIAAGAAGTARIVAYRPVPQLRDGNDYLTVTLEEVLGEESVTVDYKIPNNEPYGPHLLVAEYEVDVPVGSGVVPLTVRRADFFTVNPRANAAVLDPAYRLVLEVWFPDWR